MAKTSITKIRAAILANRGGHQNTSDAGITTLWNSLHSETRKKYLESLEERTAAKTQKHQEKQKENLVS